MGVSDAVDIFVNGQRVFQGDATYISRDIQFLGTVSMKDAMALPLKKGANQVVLVVTVARLAGPGGRPFRGGGIRTRQEQLLILNRSRKRSPNLRPSDRVVVGPCALVMRPGRFICSAIVVKPSTRLSLRVGSQAYTFHNCERFPGLICRRDSWARKDLLVENS